MNWMTKDWTIGQLNALVKKIGQENAQGILNGTVKFTVIEVQKAVQKFLKRNDEVVLQARTFPFNPDTFYRNRRGLGMSGGLEKYILPVAQPIKFLPEMTIGSFSLIEIANDLEIQSELPENYVFEKANEILAYIEGMIEDQSKGESGALLPNGCANTFYVRGVDRKVFVLYVFWNSGYKEWRVGVSSLNDTRWRLLVRVFSQATAEPLKLCS